MTPSDELRQLWQSDISEAMNQRELLRELERRSRNFDRTNRRRDLQEIAAMLVVIVVYFWFAVRAGNTFERVADVWLAACAVWFIFYLRRYAKLSRKPVPEQTLGAYRQALVERYDSADPACEEREVLVHSSHVVGRVAFRHRVSREWR